MNVFKFQRATITVMTGKTDFKVTVTQTIQPPVLTECKLYKRRWPMLILFVLCSMANAVQWIQYSIISDVVQHFYDISSFTVNLTSIVFMVTYIPLIFPASWILDKKVNYWADVNVILHIFKGSWLVKLTT